MHMTPASVKPAIEFIYMQVFGGVTTIMFKGQTRVHVDLQELNDK